MKKLHILLSLTTLIAFLTVTSCRKDEPIFTSTPAELYEGKIATDWFELLRTLTKKTAGFTPPVAARAFGYAGLTLYEATVSGMPQYQSLQTQLSEGLKLPEADPTIAYNYGVVANAAMAEVARLYYPTMPIAQLAAVVTLEDNTFNVLKAATTDGSSVLERSKLRGKAIAQAIFEWSKTDGGHQGYSRNFPTTYVAPKGLGLWEPTFPKFQPSLQPTWGNNRTFIPKCAENTQPVAPLAFSADSTSKFFKEALFVYTTVVKGSDADKATARYWSDDPGEGGTPPGHSISIATIVLQKEKANLAKAAEIYAKVGMGVSDAFVSCWKCKYVHNLVRPITYLRKYIDPNFASLLETPPFPEYPSGHSVQSGAAAQILTAVFGDKYEFTDNTHQARTDIKGTPRTYKNFFEMANEAAISRLYGGIHYREGIEKGVDQGISVGKEIVKLKFKKSQL
jgi:PAP2 superfamily